MKKIPLRRCVVTNERLPKKDLIRVVKTPQGTVVVDPTGKANGHGAYLKLDASVIATARQKKILDRLFETPVSDDIYEHLLALIK
jgi:predicted RNA-binding protein YlxR (DUF448 family)